MNYIQYMQKPALLILKLDDSANTAAYDEAVLYFEGLGFRGKTASDLALEKVHSNVLFDAGNLPEVDVVAKAWGDGDDVSRRENYQKARKAKREAEEKLLQHEMNQSIREATDKWGNAIGSGLEIASGFTPLWWVAPAVRTGLDLSEGDYKGAALNAGLAFAAPYAIGKGVQMAKGVGNRAIEAALRVGDGLATDPVNMYRRLLLGNKAKGLRYVLGGKSNFAYEMPYLYNGMSIATGDTAHYGDMIDVLMGKSNKLLTKDGQILGELTTDLSNIPQLTIKNFQGLPGLLHTVPKVLKLKYPAKIDLHDNILDDIVTNADNIPKEFSRLDHAGVPAIIPGPYKQTMDINPSSLKWEPLIEYGLRTYMIDPGHYGVTAINNGGIKVYGHDVYHFTPSKYFNSHTNTKKIFKPLLFTVGKPFIAEWEIMPRISLFDFTRRLLFNQSLDSKAFVRPKPYYNTSTRSTAYSPLLPFNKRGGAINYLNYSK